MATPEPPQGPAAGATPHRNNPAYQHLLDSSPHARLDEVEIPSYCQQRRRELANLSTIAEISTGKTQQQKGLASSHYAKQGPLDSLISELATITDGITKLAKAIDDIIEDTEPEQKGTLRKLFEKIPTYLSTPIYNSDTHQSKTQSWAQVASRPPQTPPQAPAPAKTQAPDPAPAPAHTEDLRILARVPDQHREWTRSLRNFTNPRDFAKFIKVTSFYTEICRNLQRPSKPHRQPTRAT